MAAGSLRTEQHAMRSRLPQPALLLLALPAAVLLSPHACPAARHLCPAGSPLMLAADAGRTEVAEVLVKAGADLNCQDTFGWVSGLLHRPSVTASVTAPRVPRPQRCMHASAACGAPACSHACLVLPAWRITCQHCPHFALPPQSALMLAVDDEHAGVAKLLMEAGANLDLANNAGWVGIWPGRHCKWGEPGQTRLGVHRPC